MHFGKWLAKGCERTSTSIKFDVGLRVRVGLEREADGFVGGGIKDERGESQ